MKIGTFLKAAAVVMTFGLSFAASPAWARDVHYTGSEQQVYVNPGEPTQIVFPSKIEGGFKPKNAAFALERNGNFLVIFAQPDLTDDGAAFLVLLDDKRSYALRVLPATDEHPRDEMVKVMDDREDTDYEGGSGGPDFKPAEGFSPPTIPPGLVREMILVAEYGKKKGIAGYRRSNRYTGETVLHDGSIEVKIDEIFMGSDLWGYVLSAENLLDTTQRLNPATFRLDGTRAVSAERWELSPRPQTAEQQVSGAHKAKVYVVVKSQKK